MGNFLRETNGVPRSTAIASGDLPTITLTSDVTGSGSSGSIATTVSHIQGTAVSGTTGTTNVVFSTSPSISAPAISGSGTITDAMTFVNATTPSKVLALNLAGMTASHTLTLSTSQSTTQTLTIPNIAGSDTLATLGLSQTFSAATTFNAAGTALSVTNTASIGTLTLTNQLTVPNGGTGDTSFTAFAPVIGGTTSTGALQSAATGMGTSGSVLTSNGSSAAPTWQASSSVTYRAGKTAISNGTSTVSITYSTAFANTSYAITGTMVNTTDTNPEYIPVLVTAQSTTGATFSWNTNVPTANYSIFWTAIANN